ncbi:MAG: hypothetical protein RLZ87_74 [Armatimonadota bacterium]|jgi:uncharacterized tellurite resistance protein B-like protein
MKDSMGFAVRSVEALVEIVSLLRKDDFSNEFNDLSLETARAIKCVFDRLAWSDGTLSQLEVAQLHKMLQTNEWLWNAYLQVEKSEPRMNEMNHIPKLVFIARDYDERNQSQLAHRLVVSLEMIGYGIIAADGSTDSEELIAFREYISRVRAFILPEPKKRSMSPFANV